MKLQVTGAVIAGVALGLGVPWASSVAAWLSIPGLFPSNMVEDAVFVAVVARALLYLASSRVRRMNPGKAVIMFSGDVLILPACAIGYLVTGDPSYGAFGREYLASWLSAGLLVYPLVAAVSISISVRTRSRLSSVIPASAICFGASSIVLGSIGPGAQANGLQGVAGLTLGALRNPQTQVPGASELTAVCGALLFAALAVYSVSTADALSERLLARLEVCVGGGAILVAWLLLAPPLSAWAIMGLPTAVLVGAIWVTSRGA